MTNKDKRTYYFGQTRCDGTGVSKELLGGKGTNLAEMTSIGLPVPPGFTITTAVCAAYYDEGGKLPTGLMDEVRSEIATLEAELGKKFGDSKNPLLVSVRSGAAQSMPGMMDTILNLGLTDEAVQGLATATDNERFAWDAYRRLIDMFGAVVMEVDHHAYEKEFEKIRAKYNTEKDTDVPTEGLKELCDAYKAVYKKSTGEDFPQDPAVQLEKAIEAVFRSWNAPRAIAYRDIEGMHDLIGTAVNVQTMVFGNMGDTSGTGVGFTRDKANGTNEFTGDFLVNAQGEDVVAGIRNTEGVDYIEGWNKDVFDELQGIKTTLENHYKDMQDIEFTIEHGKLFMLQTRNGKRTAQAALKIATDMVDEGLIDEETAVLRVPAKDLRQVLLPTFDGDAKAKAEVVTTGLGASPGAAVGKLAFSAEEAKERKADGESVLLVRRETSPEDVEGMDAAAGILTSTGGRTSHAAVVATGWGKCCIVGASQIRIDEEAGVMTVDGKKYGRTDVLSLDGETGEVMVGSVATKDPELSGPFDRVMQWADKYRTLGVRTNADTPADSERARSFGAEGIGLCRTEHMFFKEDRIIHMRAMILATKEAARREALTNLLPFQREDFVGIFTAMNGLPVTVRLLDPPLHEFLPHSEKEQEELAASVGTTVEEVKARVQELHESNPMLGHRGCRLSISYPEILEMQVTAIVEAVIECKKNNVDAHAEIMIPLVGKVDELRILREQALKVINTVKEKNGITEDLGILIGTMIEIPRAALTADEVAEHAQFFSFGTNDLTQMTFGFSRDDINTFLPKYKSSKILPIDPFESIDVSGVGQLVEMGVKKGRSKNADLKVGICGEHGGDPASIELCHNVGMNYVSCSPFRVPTARLAAAQAALKAKNRG